MGKKDRFGKIVWWVGVLATAILVATMGQGYSVKGAESLRPHLFLALTAILVMLFSHLWIVIYLRVLGREVAGYQEALGVSAAAQIPGNGLRWVAAAIALVLATFLLGPIGLQGTLSLKSHAVVGFLALGAQGISLWAERRDLAASGRVMGGLYAAEQRDAGAEAVG